MHTFDNESSTKSETEEPETEIKDEIKDNYIYVVSQLCEPETLKYKLAARDMVDPDDSKRIFIQICKGVQGYLLYVKTLNLTMLDLSSPWTWFYSPRSKTRKCFLFKRSPDCQDWWFWFDDQII